MGPKYCITPLFPYLPNLLHYTTNLYEMYLPAVSEGRMILMTWPRFRP